MNASRLLQRTLGTRRGRLISAATTVTASSLLLASGAVADSFTTKSGGSANANGEHGLYNIVFWVAVFVFLVVEGALVYAIWKFRAKKHPVAAQFHGNTKLELGLTAGAAGILVVLAVATFIKLPGIINPPNSTVNPGAVESASIEKPNPPSGKVLEVCVLGRQFIWKYVYGNGCDKQSYSKNLPYSYQEMTVPAGVTVRLIIQSSDVIHSWWIPSLGGKVDAEPGYTTYTWFKALHANELYHGQCAQLCGREHAFMTALVHVVTPDAYKQWLGQQQQLIQQQNTQVGQLRKTLNLNNSGV